MKEYQKQYHLEHRLKRNRNKKQWDNNNKKKVKLYSKEYRRTHKKEIKETMKYWRLTHKDEINKQHKKYCKIHKEQINEWRKEYLFNRRKNDINYKVRMNLSIRLCLALKGICKSKSTIQLLGCSIKDLRKHLQSKFQPGMSWSNYGKWHIDHIRPCAKFDLSKKSEQCKCFHYTNLQPLWAKDNLKKSNKY